MRKILLALLICLPLLGCTETVKITPDELISNMQDSYKKMESFKATSHISMITSKDGKVLSTIESELSFKRPGMYRMTVSDVANESKASQKENKKSSKTVIMCDGVFMFIKGTDDKVTRIPGARSLSDFYKSITSRSFVNPDKVITEYYLLDGKLSKEEFASTAVSPRLEDGSGKPCYMLTIDFKNGDKQILYIDKENYTIRRNVVSIVKPPTSKSDEQQQASAEDKQFLFTSDEKMLEIELNPNFASEEFRPKDMGKTATPSNDPKNLSSLAKKRSELKGKKAPAFELKDRTGETVSLESSKGKVTVLAFWDPLYKPGFDELKYLGELYSKNSAKDDLVVYAVSDDTSELRDGTFDGFKLPFSSLFDQDKKATTAYSIDVVPSIVIIGKDGNIKDIFSGIQAKDTIAKAFEAQGISK